MRFTKLRVVTTFISILSILQSSFLLPGVDVAQAQMQHITLATMSMNLEMLRETRDVWANMILNQLSKISIQDLIFEEGMVGDNKFYITGLQGDEMQDVTFEIDQHDHSFKLGVKDIDMAFQSSKFRYRSSYIAMKGATDVRCRYVSFNVTIKATRQKLADGRDVLAFKATDFDFKIPRKHVSATVHGNLEVGTAATFKRLFVGKLRDKLEDGMVHALQDELIPKVNAMIVDSRGYYEWVPGMQFDTSLQEEPTMKDDFFGLQMTGMFSPMGGPDLEPKDVELNNTGVDVPLPVHDMDKSDKKKLEVFFHQMSLTSIAVTFLKGTDLDTKVTRQESSDVTLTTSGLNDIIIQKQPKRIKKQPEGCGFVANFGADVPLELRYHVEGVRNFRIKKNNGTMILNCDMDIQFWVMDPKSGPKLALELTQSNVAFYFTAEMESSGKIDITITGQTLGKLTVTQSNLGQPPPPPPSNDTSQDDNEPKKNFGLNMHKIHAFLTKFKPTLMNDFNEVLHANSDGFNFPTKMFGGLFDMNLGNARFKFHETYLEMEMDPEFIPPKYDDTTEPRLIFEKFTPTQPPQLDEQDYTFKETISDEDKVVATRVRDRNMLEIFHNQIQIFGEVPLILSK